MYFSVIGNSDVSVQQLFAAFEEEDLKTLKSLTASIRGFKKEGSLKRAITRDNSRLLLDSLAHHHSIESFDQSSLKRVTLRDKSEPMYIYSLAARWGEDGGEQREGGSRGKGEDDVLEEKIDPAGSQKLVREEGSKQSSQDRLSSGSQDCVSLGSQDIVDSAANPSLLSSPGEEVGTVAKPSFTVSSAEQSISLLESQSRTPQTSVATSSSEAELTSEPGEVVHRTPGCEVEGVRSPGGGLSERGCDGEISPDISSESRIISESAPHVIESSGLGEDGASENGVCSHHESVTSEVSDIFDTCQKSDSDADMLSVQGSVTSEVSDIFESDDFREGDS